MKNYKEFGCIYLIQNSINNKKYIGQTTRNFNYRFNEHYNNSKKDKNMVISRAINKYNKENFNVWVLEYCTNQEELNKTEAFYINYFKTLDSRFGYNTISIDLNGKSVHSINTRKKISSIQRGRPIKNKTSKYCGVSKYKNLWRMSIKLGNKMINKSFFIEEDAAKAYDIVVLKYISDKAVLNFPELKEKYLNNEIIIYESKNTLYINKGKSNIRGVCYRKKSNIWSFSFNHKYIRSFKTQKEAEEYGIIFLKNLGYKE